jgi:hypothetical protein
MPRRSVTRWSSELLESAAGAGLGVPLSPATEAGTPSIGFSRACLVVPRSFRAFSEADNALDALLRVRLSYKEAIITGLVRAHLAMSR